MQMKLLTLALALMLVTGCAQYSSVKGGIIDQASALSDEALRSSEFMLCRGVTVGAWVRAYGASADRASAWRTICAQQLQETPALKQ